MKKKISAILMILSMSLSIYASEMDGTYSSIVEKILYYKNDKFKMFYGGPVDRSSGALRWVSLISLEDDNYKTRAVYEICFINCTFNDAKDATVLMVKVSDLNIKFKNALLPDYKVFSDLLDGKYDTGKYIVVRQADTSIVFYPEIFIASENNSYSEERDYELISQFMHNQFQTKKGFVNYYSGVRDRNEVDFEDENQILYKPIKIRVDFKESLCTFNVNKVFLKNDVWGLYYIVSKDEISLANNNEPIPTLVRIDSGCVSGQIYDDCACDCLDQLHDGLYQISKSDDEKSIIVHIPAHDGRGFGTAPKAETEIYKRGGHGRVHSTNALDTITSAKLLYGNMNYDLRTYDGVAKIIKSMGIKQVLLLTDNKLKVETLKNNGIDVIRKKTNTMKSSCELHLISKKESDNYYTD